MGRPLYSKAFQTEPIIREPETPLPYQKWSYINAFDPDSDEFFENDQAVYEAFIDHVPVEHSEDEEETEEDRETVVIRLDLTGEGSHLERDSPMAVGGDSLAQYIAQAYQRQTTEPETPVRVHLAAHDIHGEVQSDPPVSHESVEIDSSRDIMAPLDAHPQPVNFPLPTPSAPIPVPGTHSQHSSSGEGLSFSSFYHQHLSSTPPPRYTSFSRFSPSPPPTVSPRIYSWASHHQTYSPAGTSPLPNNNARMSHAHISPALVRVRDVVA
ncbi:hypothetical protein DFJ58DRAFT_778383 [Suillus subalutaceus]|uniref:uncharacterized protein n=1 Tax=Suillus subalutaceus TaxID=48586 RepID=UPI001B86C01F|nr:uncharacterized protein DFJ58DRAFT_778383 [Suillus subalutaceus]KAG1860654.1 hypothetical protein DFJ58DRAFT_778383 [Suillus subalutaceus]